MLDGEGETSNSGDVGYVGKVGGNFKLGGIGKLGKLDSEFLRALHISALPILKWPALGSNQKVSIGDPDSFASL